jgi:hypothetical protein
VPISAPKAVSMPYYPQICTAPNEALLYKNITKLIISEPAEPNTNLFDHVEMLEIRHYPDSDFADRFSATLNINRQYNANLNPIEDIPLLLSYSRTMPRLHKLSINVDFTLDLIDRLRGNRFEQIRTLEIHSSTKITRYIIEEILRLFPYVEHLHMSPRSSETDMIRLIDRFKYLSNATFIVGFAFTSSKRNWFHNIELSIRRVRRLKNGTVTCRFDFLSILQSSYSVHVWINGPVSLFLLDYHFFKL